MNYLDSNIIITVDNLSVPLTGTYTYEVQINGVTKFIGKTYLEVSQTSKSFDITDILADYKWDPTEMLTPYEQSDSTTYPSLIVNAKVVVTIGDDTYNKTESVAMIYRYPNYKHSMNLDLNYYLSATSAVYLLQGYINPLSPILIPHIPYVSTEQYPLILTYQLGRNLELDYQLSASGGSTGNIELSNQYKYPSCYRTTLTNLFEYIECNDPSQKSYLILNSNQLSNPIAKIAEIDYCPAKYYLLWQDRYGGFQSQPFDKNATYSESFDNTLIKKYDNTRKLNNTQISSQWSINTDWLDQSIYPYYESIFTSPYLLLYDTKEDKSYRVIVKDSNYIEKTFKNQNKQLFNLNLTLELAKSQNILH